MRNFIVVIPFVLSCAHNVAQDKATTADGKIKGAKPLELVNGEVKDTGIVTYPGGDRVDWKMVELPAKKKGMLEVNLKWTTPRPGLQLAFDVFDQFNASVASSSKLSRKKAQTKGRNRVATLPDATGKYFIRVYAVGRGDAGRYTLGVTFKESDKQTGIPWPEIPVADPPRLADLPGVIVPCDEFAPDLKNDECKKICWVGAPQNWPGCQGPNQKICTATVPSPHIPICAATQPCPSPADRRFKLCKPIDFKPCDPKNIDPWNLNCVNFKLPAAYAVIKQTQVVGKTVVITAWAVNTANPIGRDWTAHVISGGTPTQQPTSDTLVGGGVLTIERVDGTKLTLNSSLTRDQLKDLKWIKLTPPPIKQP